MQVETNGALTRLIEQGVGDTWEAAATADLPLLPTLLMTLSTSLRDTVISVTYSLFPMGSTILRCTSLRSTGTDQIRGYSMSG